MTTNFQFGYDLGLFIFWRTVHAARFGEKIKPLLLQSGQIATIDANELLPLFGGDFILRDGWRLYRGVTREQRKWK